MCDGKESELVGRHLRPHSDTGSGDKSYMLPLVGIPGANIMFYCRREGASAWLC